MKSRFIIGLSALALGILVAVQIIFIRQTYGVRKNIVDARYGATVREAIRIFNSGEYDLDIDSVLFVLDNLAVEYLFADPDTLEKTCGEAFMGILSEYREPEAFIRDFVEASGESADFTYHLNIREIYLKDLGYETQAYPDSAMLPGAPPGAIPVGTYTHERSFFRVTYDILVSLTHHTRMVLREMWVILLLSLLTLVMVFSAFLLTLRNMLRQKRLSEMKTDFINNMTHELKTPLSTISVASSSLGNREVIRSSERVEELSDLIKKQNRHLTQLIDRILDIHIWERDTVKIRKEPVNVEKWLSGLVRAFLVDKEARVAIDLNVDFPPQTISMDEVHLSTAVNNLLSNAVKYGNPPVRIHIHAMERRNCLEIRVTDNGPGLRREEIKNLFEKFYRGKESRQRVIRGLGLGLYYVRQITEAHGGAVRAENAPGPGASFILQIPVNYGTTVG